MNILEGNINWLVFLGFWIHLYKYSQIQTLHSVAPYLLIPEKICQILLQPFSVAHFFVHHCQVNCYLIQQMPSFCCAIAFACVITIICHSLPNHGKCSSLIIYLKTWIFRVALMQWLTLFQRTKIVLLKF